MYMYLSGLVIQDLFAPALSSLGWYFYEQSEIRMCEDKTEVKYGKMAGKSIREKSG